MLMLSRRHGETVVIHTKSGLKVRITATLSHRKGQIVLGFEAADDVHIDREEVYVRKQLEDKH